MLFNEDGRKMFHEVCCYYPRYTKEECDNLYSDILKRGYYKKADYMINIARQYNLK